MESHLWAAVRSVALSEWAPACDAAVKGSHTPATSAQVQRKERQTFSVMPRKQNQCMSVRSHTDWETLFWLCLRSTWVNCDYKVITSITLAQSKRERERCLCLCCVCVCECACMHTHIFMHTHTHTHTHHTCTHTHTCTHSRTHTHTTLICWYLNFPYNGSKLGRLFHPVVDEPHGIIKVLDVCCVQLQEGSILLH